MFVQCAHLILMCNFVIRTWMHSVLQQLDGLRRQRDRLKDELSVVMETRSKKQNLSTLLSNIAGLENKIRYAKRDKQVQVSHNSGRYIVCLSLSRLNSSFSLNLFQGLIDSIKQRVFDFIQQQKALCVRMLSKMQMLLWWMPYLWPCLVSAQLKNVCNSC